MNENEYENPGIHSKIDEQRAKREAEAQDKIRQANEEEDRMLEEKMKRALTIAHKITREKEWTNRYGGTRTDIVVQLTTSIFSKMK